MSTRWATALNSCKRLAQNTLQYLSHCHSAQTPLFYDLIRGILYNREIQHGNVHRSGNVEPKRFAPALSRCIIPPATNLWISTAYTQPHHVSRSTKRFGGGRISMIVAATPTARKFPVCYSFGHTSHVLSFNLILTKAKQFQGAETNNSKYGTINFHYKDSHEQSRSITPSSITWERGYCAGGLDHESRSSNSVIPRMIGTEDVRWYYLYILKTIFWYVTV